jgi:hypothetical protein
MAISPKLTGGSMSLPPERALGEWPCRKLDNAPSPMFRRFLFRTATREWSIVFKPRGYFHTPLFIIDTAITVAQPRTANPHDARPLGRHRGPRRSCANLNAG